IAMPYVLYQIWAFVAPGLYRNERRAFLPFILATPVLFLLGAALAYYVIFPLAWSFFISFESPGGEGRGDGHVEGHGQGKTRRRRRRRRGKSDGGDTTSGGGGESDSGA
ncbi:MAG: twin-arginine translocase subunit TatC, partial [Phycisphaerales bacterium]